jgi:GNAT superfamily N-acetyltransferase
MRYNELSQKLDEIERGGHLDDDDFVDNLHRGDFSDSQLDLFQDIPSGVPNLPSNYKLIGRMGEYFVAEKLDANKPYECYVWLTRNQAVAFVSMAPYDPQRTNYPRSVPYEIPNLNGKGLRVHAVVVRESFRGKGLGPQMYQWLLSHVCDYIIADDTHTEGGVALWKRLQKMKSIFSVHVWNEDKYDHEQRRPGRAFNYVYDYMHLVPWVTLNSKLDFVLGGEEMADAA